MFRRSAGAACALLVALYACAPGGDDPSAPSVNHAPTVRSMTLVPSAVPLGGSAQVLVDAIDPDGDRLFFRYEARAGTVTIPDPANPSQAVYSQNGVARLSDRITVTVVDTANASGTFSRNVPLQGNQPPIVEILLLGPGRFPASCHPECTLTFRADVADPDGDPVTYSWSGCASGDQPVGRCLISSPGTTTASVVVSDGRGGTVVASVEATGTNEAPTVSGGRMVSAPNAFLQPSFSDPDGDTLQCGWTGSCSCTGQIPTLNLFCDVPAGTASCAMTFFCTDPFGASDDTRFTVTR